MLIEACEMHCNGRKLKKIEQGGESVSVIKFLNVETLINNINSTIHNRGVGRKILQKKFFRNIFDMTGQFKVTIRMFGGGRKFSQCVKYFDF